MTHPRFYWLGVEGDDLRAGTTIVAQRSADRSGPVGRGPVGRGGQGIEIVEADVTALVLWLHDALVDLDEPLIVTFGDRTLFEGRVDRTIEALAASLDARRDPRLMASARLPLQLAQEPEDRDRAGAEPALGHWSPTTAGEMNDAQRAQMKEALQARDMMFSRLVATLGQVLARPAPDGGPVAAISVCRHEAPKIAGAVSAERRVKIGRTSARLRNPENRAPAWAAALIGDTLEDDQEPQDFPVARFATHLDGSLGGVMPIRTLATCLACHGPAETLDPELRAALGAEYPTDRAVGYRENELRGWFWVEVPPR